MSNVRRKDVTTPCRKCGAAMVIVRVWPLPAAVDHVEVHMFKCEFCSATEFYRFKTAAAPTK
jgi:predicted nucleic-acid-binding Zn-ribbon protein